MNKYQRLVIGSAARKELTDAENFGQANELEELLKWGQYSYERTKGVLNDNKEITFVILFNTNDQLEKLEQLFLVRYKQESILEQDISGYCHLLKSKGDNEMLGRLKQYPESEAHNFDNYTEMKGTIYVAA